MKTAYYCMDNPKHQMFKANLDGARCPECSGLVSVKEVTNAMYYTLPTYEELKQKFNKETTNKNRKQLTIEVGMNTNKLQLKLRAIAKHTEALANELDAIDNAWECPECGHDCFTTIHGSDEPYSRCDSCLTELVELPTRLEGSE